MCMTCENCVLWCRLNFLKKKKLAASTPPPSECRQNPNQAEKNWKAEGESIIQCYRKECVPKAVCCLYPHQTKTEGTIVVTGFW